MDEEKDKSCLLPSGLEINPTVVSGSVTDDIAMPGTSLIFTCPDGQASPLVCHGGSWVGSLPSCAGELLSGNFDTELTNENVAHLFVLY